ncbi:hypothetical protein [Amycolatopsis rifamycinica]|uniref:hypothetical protein n=1 Tax=Amycolatopsis rifamycinica TaxID=287986 RepID=UPI00136463DC|nr:hypothetical protein [Amycolatopsis rifamycinica]
MLGGAVGFAGPVGRADGSPSGGGVLVVGTCTGTKPGTGTSAEVGIGAPTTAATNTAR